MSIRTYAGLLFLEDLFDIPTYNNTVADDLASLVFSPNVMVAEEDCGTLIGTMKDVNYDLEGHTELATGLPISLERIEELLFQGVYKTPVRHLSSCVAKGGVCQACYYATHPKEFVPAVGEYVKLPPEYDLNTEIYPVEVGDKTFDISMTAEEYDRLYVYFHGKLQDEDLYTVSGTTITFKEPFDREGNLAVRPTVYARSPFVAWLANTYSGSILGMRSLPAPPLHVRKSLITEALPISTLQYLVQFSETLPNMPSEMLSYISSIRDPFEQALFTLACYALFSGT